MTSEQFCLKWNNHQSTLVSVFDGLFESGTLVDCTLAADGQYLKAHKVVLCACSPYLEMILSQHYNQHPIVILKDVKFEELQAIMEYMYRGEVNVTQEQLGHFLKAAEMLQVKGLINNDRSSGASAQIVSSPMRAKDASDVKTAFKKKDLQSSSKSSTSGQLSSVDTLDLIPSKLVIDIPPISPVNNAKDNSVSPNPLKRKKSFQLLSEVKSVRSSGDGASNSKSVYGSGNLTFEVDRNEIVNSQITKGAIKQEEISNDSYDSDGLVVDEDFNDVKYDPEPGPSNASGAGAAADDGCAWKALAHSEEHPESTKGGLLPAETKTIAEFLEYLALEPKGTRKTAAANLPLLRRKLRKRKTKMAPHDNHANVRKIQHQIKFKTKTPADKLKQNKMAVIKKKLINYKRRADQLKAAAKNENISARSKSAENGVKSTESTSSNDSKENIVVKEEGSAVKPKVVKKLKASLKKSSTSLDKKGVQNKQTGMMSENGQNKKIYCCDKCDKAYSRKSSLYRHVTYECGKEHSFHCPHCSYGAYQKVHLNRHLFLHTNA